MKRLIFNRKYFTREKERDFEDDGNYFRCYCYKGIMPITVCHCKEAFYGGNSSIFAQIRLDYMGKNYAEYKEDYNITQMFNGVSDINFNMEKLIENCEYLLKKYF